jgi:hypothetical protein
LEWWEQEGARGLSLLNQRLWYTSPTLIHANAYHSISFLPKIGSVTDWDAKQLDEEIEKVLLCALEVPLS